MASFRTYLPRHYNMRVLILLFILFVTGSICHNAGYHRVRVVNAMYNSQKLRIDIIREDNLVRTFNLAYKEYSEAFWIPFGVYSIETYKDDTNILLTNAFIGTINYNAFIMLSGDYPDTPFTALVEDVSSVPTGATLRVIHALTNTTLDVTFDSVYQNLTNAVRIQAREWRTTPGIKTLEVRHGSEDLIGSAEVELVRDMPHSVIIMGRLDEQIDLVSLPPVDFAVELRINIINLKSEPITVTDTLDGSTLNTITFNSSTESGYIGLIPGYRSFFVFYSTVDSVVMFLEGFVEYTLIFTDDKEPMLFVDRMPPFNHGEAALTFALVGAVNSSQFNVSYNGGTFGPLNVNAVNPYYFALPCCGSYSFMVGQTSVQVPSFDLIRNKVTRIVVLNNGATFLQKIATFCGEPRVRVLNALLKGPAAIRVSIEGVEEPLVPQLQYGELTEYQDVELRAGLYRFTVTDMDGNYMFTSCARLNGGEYHTIMAIGDAAGSEQRLKLWTLQDDNTEPNVGTSRVRAVYAVSDLFDQDEVVLTATNPGRLAFPVVNYQTVTNYFNLPGSNYSVKLTVDSEVIGTIYHADMPAGSVVSFFVLGSAKDHVFDIVISIDTQYMNVITIVEPVAQENVPVMEPHVDTPVRPRTPGLMKVPLVTVHDSAANMVTGCTYFMTLLLALALVHNL